MMNFDLQFIKYLFVGGINTLFGWGVFSLCIFLKFHYTIATLVSTILGILFNFKTTGSIVFKNNDNRLIKKFFAVYALVYLIGISELKLCSIIGMTNMHINYAIFVLPNALISYYMMKKLVFK